MHYSSDIFEFIVYWFYNSDQIPCILISSVIVIKSFSKGKHAFNTETGTKEVFDSEMLSLGEKKKCCL